jgi:DNA-binding NtrC family response regulator
MPNDTVLFIGDSPRFCIARDRLRRIAGTDATVLIEGETGTGKELAARLLHYEGARSSGPFIPVNCGAIPDALLESELFGHARGAFTDAKNSVPGMLLLADGGTLFLDEVDSLSPHAQVALLRFLQDHTIRPLGSGAERKVDVRVVSATNRSLQALVAAGHFRADLFYRLNVFQVEMPPLREREADVELFVQYFVRQLSQRHGLVAPELDAASIGWMRRHSWPGNVRELENLIERELLLADGLRVLHFSFLENTSPAAGGDREGWNYRVAKAAIVADFDRRFLEKLMRFAGGNVALAARAAGKERRDLGRLLRKYAIAPAAFRSPAVR